MKNLLTTLCLTIAVLLGSMGVSLGEEVLTGEYLRALKTMGGSGLEWVDIIFRYCSEISNLYPKTIIPEVD
jgi:hypothetical protein